MEKYKIKRIVIIIVLFFLACAFTVKVNAALDVEHNTSIDVILGNFGDGLSLRYENVALNKYLFCRDRTHMFPRGQQLTYKIDDEAYVTHNRQPKTYTSQHQGNGSAWAYLFGKNINLGSANQLSNSSLQQAFWQIAGQDVMKYSDPLAVANCNTTTGLSDEVKNLIEEAKSYENISNTITENNIKTNGPDEKMIESPQSLENLGTETEPIYGPFKINCNSWNFNGKLKAGITQLQIYSKDNNNNVIGQPEYQILYNLNDSYDNTPKFGSIGGNAENIKVLSVNKYQNDIITLNNNMMQEFYIRFSQGYSGAFTISVKYKCINAAVEFRPIKSSQQISYYDDYRCYQHDGWDFSSLVNIGGYKCTFIDSGTTSWSSTKSYSSWVGNIYNQFTNEETSTYCNACGKMGYGITTIREGYTVYKTVCANPQCHANASYVENRYRYFHKRYQKFVCNISSNCGKKVQYTGESQKLLVANPTYTEKEIDVTEDITPVVEIAKIKLRKFDSFGLYNRSFTAKDKLQAKYKVTINQDGGEVFWDEYLDLGAPTDRRYTGVEIPIKVETTSKSSVYITIEEIEAPFGYKNIKPINIMLEYNSEKNTYDWAMGRRIDNNIVKGIESESYWTSHSGFSSSTYGNWEYLNEEIVANKPEIDALNEVHKHQKYLDGLNVTWDHYFKNDLGEIIEDVKIYSSDEQQYSNHEINIYDEPEPLKLTLKKFGSYFDETRSEIPEGSKFTIKAYQALHEDAALNISNLVLENLNIKTESKSGKGLLEGVLSNELIEITPMYMEKGAKSFHICVIIEEKYAPAGYTPLSRPIIIKYNFDDNGIWQSQFRVMENPIPNNHNIAIDYFREDYTLWDWVKTEEDLSSNGYSTAFPNVYCINPNSNSSAEILEEAMCKNYNIKDVIRVEKDDRFIISVFNERENRNRDINLELQKFAVETFNTDNGEIENIDPLEGVEFKVDVLQGEITEAHGGNYRFNLIYSNTIDLPSNNNSNYFKYTLDESILRNLDENLPIYFIIREAKTPSGYKTIKPINIKYIYDSNHRKWKANYLVEENELETIGQCLALSELNGVSSASLPFEEFEDEEVKSFVREFLNIVYGEWDNAKYINDEGQEVELENEYLSSSGDKIIVDDNGVINVYNKLVKFSSIELSKVNRLDKVLKGATFSGTISNVKSLNVYNNIIEQGLNGTFTFNNIKFESGRLIINDVILKNSEDDVVITLVEDEVPTMEEEEYNKILGTMTIRLSYKNKTATISLTNGGTNITSVPINVTFDKEDNPNVEIQIINTRTRINNKITIDKLDGNTFRPLTGSKFNGTIYNIISFEDEQGNRYTSSDGYTYEFTNWELPKTLNYVEFAYDEQEVVIELEEITAPEGYDKILGTIGIVKNGSEIFFKYNGRPLKNWDRLR